MELQVTDKLSLAWIDLETTGSDETKDHILEVGLIVTDHDFNEHHRDFWVARPTTDFMMDMPAEVRVMHSKNHLLDDVYEFGGSIEVIDVAVAQALKEFGRRFLLAGSGVAHFDRRFIRAYMPKTDRMLNYAALDVGQVRRFLHYSGVTLPEPPEKNHRALDDIAAHLDEARTYRRLFSEMAVPA